MTPPKDIAAILLVITTFPFIFSIEITVCECDKPTIIGLLDMTSPKYCNNKEKHEIKAVFYEEINLVHDTLHAEGYLCRQWQRNKTIIGHFFSYEISETQKPVPLTPSECKIMAETKTCQGRPMTIDENTAYFDEAPNGDKHWLRTDEYIIYNCFLEKFNVSQECPQCPINSPFGILQQDPDSESKTIGIRKGQNTLIWNVPVVPKNYNCDYKITRRGKGLLLDIGNPEISHIRDEENQLEFIFKKEREDMCSFNNVHKIAGIQKTFIRYVIISTDRLKSAPQPRPLTSVTYEESLILNDEIDLCVGTGSAIYNATLLALPCKHLFVKQFAFYNNRVLFYEDESRCMTVDSHHRVKLSPCLSDPNARSQKWNFNSTEKILKNRGRCLTAVLNKINATKSSYNLEMIPCDETSPNTYKKWKFAPKNILSDDPALVEEAFHRQFAQGTSVEMANTITNEIKNIYCEALRLKQFHAMLIAHSSPILAGIALGLPTCRRVQADGLTLIVQQCRTTRQFVDAVKTRCGYEPRIGNFTIGKDGFTKQPFIPCMWKTGVINLNGKSYEYINDSYQEIIPNIKLSTVGLKLHFEEIVDNEIVYLHNLETAFNAKALDQLHTIEELMLSLDHDAEDNPSQIVLHPRSQLNIEIPKISLWNTIITAILNIVFVAFIILITIKLTLFCIKKQCNSCIQPFRNKEHRHKHVRINKFHLYEWDDGCPVEEFMQNPKSDEIETDV